jgi:hypothetical protein
MFLKSSVAPKETPMFESESRVTQAGDIGYRQPRAGATCVRIDSITCAL